MRLSTRGCYGLRAMMDLARQYGEGPVLMQDIADNQGVSRKYLHALLTMLKSKGLVRSVRGAGGGYVLTREPEKIKLREVIEALEGTLAVAECSADPSSCARSSTCAATKVWRDLNQVIATMLGKISIADMIKN